MSTDKNSFLSYLARIHCSRRSLHVEHSVFTYCMLALITGTHTQISLGSSAHLLHVFFSAFAPTFIAPLGLRKDKMRRARPERKMPLSTCAHPERHAIDISSGFRQLSAKRPFPREARASSSHSVVLLSFVRSSAPLRVQSKLDCGVFYNH